MSKLRIVQLSDPHFGTVVPEVANYLLECLRSIRPDLILLTGDITQRARRKQFIAAREFIDNFKTTPFLAVPGNHDIPLFNIFGRLFWPYHGFQNFFKANREEDYLHGDVRVTCLNSTSKWRHIQGSFDHERLEKRLAEKNPQTKVHIVALHHPLDCAKVSDEKNLLKRRGKAMELFARHNIDLIVSGHIHDPYVNLAQARYPQIKRNIILGVAGTCLSWRIRPGAPNSFNLIEVDTDQQVRIAFSRYDHQQGLGFIVHNTKQYYRNDQMVWCQVRRS